MTPGVFFQALPFWSARVLVEELISIKKSKKSDAGKGSDISNTLVPAKLRRSHRE